MRAGYGEYYEEGEHSETKWFARSVFLEALKTLVPQTLTDLKTQVCPLYRKLGSPLRKEPVIRDNVLTGGWRTLRDSTFDGQEQDVSLFLQSLEAWAERYNLAVEWLFDAALATLYHWVHKAEDDQWHDLRRTGGFNVPLEEGRFSFVFRGWIPLLWTRAAYEHDITFEFERNLRAYLDRVESGSVERGLAKTPEWRKRTDIGSGRRFSWLVEWQVQQWTLRRIADSAGVGGPKRTQQEGHVAEHHTGITTVRSALRSAAEEIGLPLRKGKQGRPRGRT